MKALKLGIFFFFIFALAFAQKAVAANIIFIESDCVMVEDVFPGIGIKDQVFCGIDYGETRKLSVQLATHIINKYNIKASPGEAYFSRRGKKVETSEIEAAIYEKLSRLYPTAELQIEKIRIPSDIYTAENGRFNVEISNPRIGGMYGKLNNGFKDIGFTVFVKGYMDVFVASERIRKGEPISRYIKTERVDLARVKGDPITDGEGLIASRNIGAGTPITGDLVSEIPDMPEGAAIILVYNENGINLEARGILQENAYTGSIVKVKNADSGKIITARYIGNKRAVVNH